MQGTSKINKPEYFKEKLTLSHFSAKCSGAMRSIARTTVGTMDMIKFVLKRDTRNRRLSKQSTVSSFSLSNELEPPYKTNFTD